MRGLVVGGRWPVAKSLELNHGYSQVRRSSRSICLNLREAWAKRRYKAHFIAKLTDCDSEANETDTAIDFAHDCGNIDQATHQRLKHQCSLIGAMLGTMVNQAHRFTPS